jgi:hypothetical protein
MSAAPAPAQSNLIALDRLLRLSAAAIAGLQALAGLAVTAAATLGAIMAVGFLGSMCTTSNCDSLGVLIAKATPLVALFLVTLIIAPGLVALGLLTNRHWAPYAGVLIELILAVVTGIWLAMQLPALLVTYVVAIPMAAITATLLMAGLLLVRKVSHGDSSVGIDS